MLNHLEHRLRWPALYLCRTCNIEAMVRRPALTENHSWSKRRSKLSETMVRRHTARARTGASYKLDWLFLCYSECGDNSLHRTHRGQSE